MGAISEILQGIPLPRMIHVYQSFPKNGLKDPMSFLRSQLEQDKFKNRILPGMSIAITCGSRGIANYPETLREIVSFCKENRAKPFIIPAMGSHGGATADGQREMCETLGVTEEFCGCPIRATMDTVPIGFTDEGHVIQIDRFAHEADGIIIVNRIKAHTVFCAPYESGLMKMCAIGLGKQHGAQVLHQLGYGTIGHNIPLFGKAILQKANILFGVGLIDNAYEETENIEVLLPDEIEKREPELLIEAKQNMARLLPGSADVLIVDYMGKNISGDGMDPHITGKFHKWYHGEVHFTCDKLAVLDLTPESHGNFAGIEVANVMSKKLQDKMDPEATYPNSLTSCSSQSSPMCMKNDKETIQAAIKICGGVQPEDIRVIRIRDTLHVSDILVSENMTDTIRDIPGITIGDVYEWTFDENGNLW